MVYGFGFIWSKLGYATVYCGAPSLLAAGLVIIEMFIYG